MPNLNEKTETNDKSVSTDKNGGGSTITSGNKTVVELQKEQQEKQKTVDGSALTEGTAKQLIESNAKLAKINEQLVFAVSARNDFALSTAIGDLGMMNGTYSTSQPFNRSLTDTFGNTNTNNTTNTPVVDPQQTKAVQDIRQQAVTTLNDTKTMISGSGKSELQALPTEAFTNAVNAAYETALKTGNVVLANNILAQVENVKKGVTSALVDPTIAADDKDRVKKQQVEDTKDSKSVERDMKAAIDTITRLTTAEEQKINREKVEQTRRATQQNRQQEREEDKYNKQKVYQNMSYEIYRSVDGSKGKIAPRGGTIEIKGTRGDFNEMNQGSNVYPIESYSQFEATLRDPRKALPVDINANPKDKTYKDVNGVNFSYGRIVVTDENGKQQAYLLSKSAVQSFASDFPREFEFEKSNSSNRGFWGEFKNQAMVGFRRITSNLFSGIARAVRF